MDEQTAEKFAELLGKCAATGDSRELVKQAGLPEILLASLAGAGVGGAAGYFGTEKEKNKARNAVYGALTGGLGAGGLQTAYHYLGNSTSPDINGGGGDAGGGIGAALAAAGATAATPFKSLGNFVGASLGAGAANVPISGRSFATRMADRASNLYERVTGRGRYSGELDAALRDGVIKAHGGKGKMEPAQLLRAVIEQRPDNLSVQEITKNRSFTAPSDPANHRTAFRDSRLANLDAMINRLYGGKQQLPKDFFTQLAAAHKGPRGRTAARGAARVGGTVAGGAAGMAVNYALETILNRIRGMAAE